MAASAIIALEMTERTSAQRNLSASGELYDFGVAGVHRLMHQRQLLANARVIVAVAGMDGALPGLIAGLVGCPVIAVPTSVGYGTGLGGVAALMNMLNACAPGMAVANIDNGFGAGYFAAMIAWTMP
jgi:NCAIR mutase (PurE)-related protein